MLFYKVLRFLNNAQWPPYVASLLQNLNFPACLSPLFCFCPLQKTQDMTMTLSQSLSSLQVAQVFPLFFRYVHVSTVSHHANRILIPFQLEWFTHSRKRKISFFHNLFGACGIWLRLWFLWPLFYVFVFTSFSILTSFSLQQPGSEFSTQVELK